MKRILALICAIACLSLLCVPALAASTVTVYVDAPDDWSDVYLYYWFDDQDSPVTWPGTAMNDDGDGWYSLEIPSDATNIIANTSAGSQTVDLKKTAGQDAWLIVGEAGADGKFSGTVASDPQGTPMASTPAASAELTDAYVAGVGALCGAEWDPAAPANQMTEISDGVFEITYKNVAVGTYQFKVTNGTWDASWGGDGPDGNYVLNVELAGDVTITFDSATSTITVSGAGSQGSSDDIQVTEPQPVELTNAYVAGVGALCGAEWDAAGADNQMTEVSDGVFEITYKNVAAGSYEFKVTDGTWDHSWGADGGADNYILTVESAGDVTITFDSATSTITTTVGAPTTETEPTEAPTTEPTEAPTTEPTEATEETEATDATEPTTANKSAARTKTILTIVLVLVCIVGVAVVISVVPKKNA